MGLSEEERMYRVFVTTHQLFELYQNYELDEKYHPFLENIWGELNDKCGYSPDWLLCSEVNMGTFVGSAIILAQSTDEKNKYDLEMEKYQAYKSEYPSFDSILRETHIRFVPQIYEGCQSILYAINRYNDDFSKKMASFAHYIGRIMGLVYQDFSTNIFKDAFILYHLAQTILSYDDEDLVTRWWKDHCVHHYYGVNYPHNTGVQGEELLALWKRVKEKRELTDSDRVVLTLRVIGDRYHYEHQHISLLNRIDTPPIRETLEKDCVEIKQHSSEKFCHLTGV